VALAFDAGRLKSGGTKGFHQVGFHQVGFQEPVFWNRGQAGGLFFLGMVF
jgi:hypothetical protein